MNRIGLLLTLLLTLVLAGCAQKRAEQVKVDPALQTLVPADTVLLAGVRLDALMKTPIYADAVRDGQLPQIEDFARRTGLDPRKDLWELLYVSNGQRSVLLGRGKFADEMEPNLEKQGGKRFGYKGLNFIGNETAAVMLLNPSTAAVGSPDALRYLADQREKSNGPPAALSALLSEIPPEAQAWAAYTGGKIRLPFEAGSDLGNINKVMESIQSGVLYADLRSGISLVGSAMCASDEAAQQLQGAFKAFAGLGRLSVPKDQPELAQIYDGIRVTQEGHRVKLYIDASPALAGKLLNTLTGRRPK